MAAGNPKPGDRPGQEQFSLQSEKPLPSTELSQLRDNVKAETYKVRYQRLSGCGQSPRCARGHHLYMGRAGPRWPTHTGHSVPSPSCYPGTRFQMHHQLKTPCKNVVVSMAPVFRLRNK